MGTWLVRSLSVTVVSLFLAPVASHSIAQTPRTAEERASIPTLDAFLGHPAGQRAVRYEKMVEYFKLLDESSPLVTFTPYAESHEGRTLFYITVTSEANHARLPDIQAENAKLADPRKLAPDKADSLAEKLPGIAWLAYNIHGDELSSTDAAMQVAYRLASQTDEFHAKLRDELVIHIDPLMNPDGRERYLVQLENLTGKVPNTDYQSMQHNGLWSAGRGNHYLFDLNRDWLMLVHPETQGRSAAILSWNPHLLVDSHEMGGLDTYLFDPPREPFNIHLSEKNLEWRRRFSADQAAAMDQHGWSYYTQEWYEEWYPGYTNAWANLLGMIGILYEQAGVNSAALKQPAGTLLTYDEAVQHHVVSSFANLASLRANRREVLKDFSADRAWAVSNDGPHSETFLLPPGSDPSRIRRFLEVLVRHGIECQRAQASFKVDGVASIWGETVTDREFPVGTVLVKSSQPHRRLMHAILGFDPAMSEKFLNEERKELERRRESKLYDVTAWNLPMAYGLEAFWTTQTPTVAVEPVTTADVNSTFPLTRDFIATANERSSPGYGYIIDGASADLHAALVILMNQDAKVRVATKPFRMEGRDYAAGAVLLRGHENRADFSDLLLGLPTELKLDIRNVKTALSQDGPDLGGQKFQLLQTPRVAVATQWPISTTSFGWVWYLLDQRLGLSSSPINLQSLGQLDLRRYNVLILPDSWEPTKLAAVLDAGAIATLKAWVQAGGTLIAQGGSAEFIAGKDVGLSEVRLRQDVLDKLPVYAEAVQREKDARTIAVDLKQLWPARSTESPPASPSSSTTQPSGEEIDDKGKEPESEVERLKRLDEWQRIFSPSGVILRADLDTEHWLTFGLGDRLPVLLSGSSAYMSMHPISTPVRLSDAAHMRMSGLLWPEARRRWADTAYATVESVGHGQIILFAVDPFFRGYFEGSGRLLANAIVLGPGMGTSQPVPW